ncbi:hypothetical protein T09_5715 [Trichinella sp. T9]|nr:hypothetical protein T09_5715 [Trichinella sp. T9]
MVRNNGAPDGATLARTNINYRWLPVGRQCAEALMFSQRNADGHLMAPLRQPPLRSSDSQPHMLVVRRRDFLGWSIIRRHTSNEHVTPTRSASFPLEQHFRSPINLIFDFLDYSLVLLGPVFLLLVFALAVLLDRQIFVVMVFILLGREVFVILVFLV